MKAYFKYLLSFFYFYVIRPVEFVAFKLRNRPICTVPILCYHSVNQLGHEDARPILPGCFHEQLEFLKKEYDVISLNEFVLALMSNAELPSNAVVITFDDGFVDNYTEAFPVLQKFQVPATIFLVTGLVNRELVLLEESAWGGMTWNQVREMNSTGLIDFGVHTHTHQILTSIPEAEQIKEIQLSRKILEKELSSEMEYFAYPNGQGCDIPKNCPGWLEKNSFKASCSTYWRTINSKQDMYTLNRVMMDRSDSMAVFKSKLKGGYDYLFYAHKVRAYLSRLRGVACYTK